jgi:prolyl-tRNA synthetase
MEKEEFSEWYNDILKEAEIMDVRYPVKGLYVWYPFGYALKRRVYDILRSLLDGDHEEVLFPLLIPETELIKEKEHIKGFEDEVYWVTKGGSDILDVPLVLRPTSETAIYPMFRLWIRSHSDLPIKIYQIVNTFRHETKSTKPLIRDREITSFKEAHTAHMTWEEAKKQTEKAVRLYKRFFDAIAIPYIISRRPDWDKFPGADYSIAFDTLMPDGKTLQIGTIHHLGMNFARTFDIKYEDEKGEWKYVHQTCYGISERCIAAVISVHGDERGLVLPPEVAPIQVVIVPIIFSDSEDTVMDVCKRVYDEFVNAKIRVKIDDAEERPGAKYYRWEKRGVPIRIEIGPRDVEEGTAILVRRDKVNKERVPFERILDRAISVLKAIYEDLYENAKIALESRIFACESLEDVKDDSISKIGWCGREECGRRMEDVTGMEIFGESLDEKLEGKCPICGAHTERLVYMAKKY